MKILLVEDNPMNRDMLSRRLARRGFDVIVAVDGREALKRVADEKPDVVLMDLSLPVLSGWEATRRLKAAPETAGIPVIALTAHALSGDYQRAIEAGCDEYETKPVNLDRLIGKIDGLRGTDKASSA
jgi:CheY-like chemotaxis protein